MKRILAAIVVVLALAGSASAQCLSIPNGDTRGLVWSVFDGKPFTQQTLTDAEPFLNAHAIQLTPPNHDGERTKIGDPLSRQWTRIGFGEGHPVWIPQGQSGDYTPIACAVQPPPVVVPPPVVAPPPPQPPPAVFDTLALQAILAKLDEVEKHDDANAARLEAAINEPGWFKTFFSNRYVQMALGVVSGWLATKAAQ